MITAQFIPLPAMKEILDYVGFTIIEIYHTTFISFPTQFKKKKKKKIPTHYIKINTTKVNGLPRPQVPGRLRLRKTKSAL